LKVERVEEVEDILHLVSTFNFFNLQQKRIAALSDSYSI
jgi:hypothetical protein